jgi:rhodanese-related sulfurtransferase
MKKLLLFVLFILLGWEVFWALMGVKSFYPWQLQENMAQTPGDLVLLDVRTPWEFQWFHLPGAQNVPFEKGLPPNLTIPTDKTVVVICMTGHRSPLVAYRLLHDGYSRVYNLTGGMAGWKAWKWVEALGHNQGSDSDHPNSIKPSNKALKEKSMRIRNKGEACKALTNVTKGIILQGRTRRAPRPHHAS